MSIIDDELELHTGFPAGEVTSTASHRVLQEVRGYSAITVLGAHCFRGAADKQDEPSLVESPYANEQVLPSTTHHPKDGLNACLLHHLPDNEGDGNGNAQSVVFNPLSMRWETPFSGSGQGVRDLAEIR